MLISFYIRRTMGDSWVEKLRFIGFYLFSLPGLGADFSQFTTISPFFLCLIQGFIGFI